MSNNNEITANSPVSPVGSPVSASVQNTAAPSEITALQIAQGIGEIYDKFTESVKALGSKHGIKSGKKIMSSVTHWLAGSHVRTERDILCDKFLEDVQSQLQMLDYALEGADEASVREACTEAAGIMTQTYPVNSNSTTDLMRRAMIGQALPYLKHLPKDDLLRIKQRLESAYSRWNQLPVEKDVLKELNRLLTDSPSAK